MKINTCHECKYFIWPTEYRFYGHCLMNGHYFLPDYMSCERFESNEKSGRTANCCGNCGKPVHSEGEYCHHCGARLEWK